MDTTTKPANTVLHGEKIICDGEVITLDHAWTTYNEIGVEVRAIWDDSRSDFYNGDDPDLIVGLTDGVDVACN